MPETHRLNTIRKPVKNREDITKYMSEFTRVQYDAVLATQQKSVKDPNNGRLTSGMVEQNEMRISFVHEGHFFYVS